MDWLASNWRTVLDLAVSHLYLAGVPLVVGLVLSVPLGWTAKRWSRTYFAIITSAGLLYTIPSLALFVVMPLIVGTKILDPLNVVIAMSVYTVALLARTVADGLTAVPDHVEQAATAMGYKGLRRLFGVELPLAVPVVAAGLRVAAVSNVSIVSVASIVGISQLGDLLVDGYNRVIWGELVTGILATVLLALVLDALIVAGAKVLTPWTRAAGGRA
ncbi:ABC transporter permease subunit [Phycicoccus endophyticus]|uniref:ABC transporter permease subunit n=1 Tax=Phycicoccus endophyticus TaxID=1690220 RepID=A0A7G9R1H1_9MICO|nr:ABC transporter permease subunit [Phycicoccus endophyticus]NHI18766.1 ABC transporter permease subunit [Phycicoccus endophyticus]QNN49446.1 ABC transporter permease subunit [Phycicoccus endophyticus]GGL36717.1 glycine/betaine ABC transporter permease [Phycicoccus endophyticus]